MDDNKYPYLVVRIYNAVYKPMYMGWMLTVEELIIEGIEIYEKNKMESCVISKNYSFYIKSSSLIEIKKEPPNGGIWIEYHSDS